jgi:gamma-glutamylputrescine oxidase
VVDSYWLAEQAEDLPRVRFAGPPDVAIVGGGVTGCSCAFTLARAGRSVRLYEAREIASGASGRNGGFALRGGATAYHHAREQLGREAARELWELTERALDRLGALAGDAFRPTGSLRLAASAAEREELVGECAALRKDGFAVEWQDEPEGALRGHYVGAILHPPDGSLQPVRWVRRLARLAAEAGAEIREHARVASLADLEAEHVVIATDGYTRGLLPELDAAVRPTRGQVVTTEPLRRSLFRRPHYARYGYDYWQQTPDGRLVVGGRRDVDLEQEYTAVEATTASIQDALEGLIRTLLGRLPRLTHRWAGIFATTADRLPLVGPVPGRPGVWVACGYSGHGNVLGFACGELVGEAILGRRHAALELFDARRALGTACGADIREAPALPARPSETTGRHVDR